MPDVLYNRRKPRRDDTLSLIAEQVLGGANTLQDIFAPPVKPPMAPPPVETSIETPLAETPIAPPEEPKVLQAKVKAKPSLDRKPVHVDPIPAGSAFVEGMMRRGWTVEEAAGVAGNAHVESRFNPGINEKQPIAGRGGYGFIQLTGPRRVAYEQYATDTGRKFDDPEAQMDWLNMERTGESAKYGINEKNAYQRALGGGGTPEDIAQRFGQYVERPKDLGATLATRRQAAAKYAYIDDITNRLIGG